MGISLIFIGVAGVIVFVAFIVSGLLFLKKDEKGIGARKFSYAILGLLILHWVFFLVNGYAILPTNIAVALFTPIWLILCVAGVITAIYEFKNNMKFAIPLAALTAISVLFTIFSYGF